MKVKRTIIGNAHTIAYCTVCHKQWEAVETAAKQARDHTKTTGHPTKVEKGISYQYKRIEE
jgi:hypothetical protein